MWSSTRSRVLLILGCLLAAGTAAHLMIARAPGSPSHESVVARSSSPAAAVPSSKEIPDPGPVAASSLQPVTPEEVEPSQLPLTLLGTFATNDPSLSRATLRHRESQETLVVGVGDVIDGHAVVVQIERERVVVRDDGSLLEIRLEVESTSANPSPAATSGGSGVPVPSTSVDSEARLANLESALVHSTGGQARMLPELDGDRWVGLHVSAIQEDSRFAQIGLEEDDVITHFNGISLDSPFVALHAAREMSETDRYHVMVRRGDATVQLDSRRDEAGS